MSEMSRRTLLAGTGAGLATGIALPWIQRASAAKTTLIGVEWGGPWLEAAKEVAAKQSKYAIQWEAHAGPAAAIMSKIKAAWPNPIYDFVVQYDPLYYAWMAEGWPEPMSIEEMPNLGDISADAFVRNDQGQIINVPLSNSGLFWGYRSDIVPFEITKHEDLLDPRLKGQLCVRDVLQGQNTMVVMFAKAFGGDERNMEPGWEFMRELAASGNIGRIGKTEVDFINSLTTGETSVGFWSNVAWGKISESAKCTFLNRVPGDKIFRTGLVTEGFMIPKNSTKTTQTKDFLNFFVSPENNELYNMGINLAPTNSKSRAGPIAQNIVFKDDRERKEFAVTFDFVYLSEQQNAMSERWERDILPLVQ